MKKLKTERYYKELFDLYSLYMSPRAAKSALNYLCNIERHRGYKGIADVMFNYSRYILGMHLRHGRESLISKLRDNEVEVKGPLRHFFLISLRSGKRGGLNIALQLVDSRGFYFADEPTDKDIKRKASSLRDVFDPFESYSFIDGKSIVLSKGQSYLKTAGEFYNLPVELQRLYSTQYGIDLKFPPYPFKKGKKTLVFLSHSVPQNEVSPVELVQALDLCPYLVSQHYYYIKWVVGELLPPLEHFSGASPDGDVVGTVHSLIKDRKGKNREIFNPLWLLIALVFPLHSRQKRILNLIECSFVFDQDGGVEWAVQMFKAGREVSSIDLKTASDNIALSPQLREMNLLMQDSEWGPDIAGIFEKICRSKWMSPYRKSSSFVRLLKGTPMGIPGSYNGFSLRLIRLFLSAGVPIKDFAMVGDDIIYASEYDSVVKSILKFEEIPISVAKSIFASPNLAEFCGKLITRLHGPLKVTKAKALDMADPLSYIERYGAKSVKIVPLSSRERKLLALSKIYKDNQDYFNVLFFDDKLEIPAIGGYSTYQLRKMGIISRKEFIAANTLISYPFQKNPDPFSKVLTGFIRYTVKDRKTRALVSDRFRLLDFLPISQNARTFDSARVIHFLGMTEFTTQSVLDSYHEMLEEVIYTLVTRSNQREDLQLAKIRPIILHRMDYRRGVQLKTRVPNRYNTELIELYRKYLDTLEPTEDQLKPTVLTWAEEDSLAAKAVRIDVDSIVPTQFKSDLEIGRRVEALADKNSPEAKKALANTISFSSIVNYITGFLRRLW